MADPTEETLTFLFTDIEGSATLAQQYEETLASLLSLHHAILHEAITRYNGRVFQIIGDAFCARFQTTHEALYAALSAQHRLQDETEISGLINVRMGIHTGGASPGDLDSHTSGYTGYLTLTRAQRIMSVAHGGQILLSNASVALLRGQLPPGITLRDLGEHRLKGLGEPEHLWQIVAPGLASEFPPLPSPVKIPGNLPVSLTSFIGREIEIGEVKSLLDEYRLVTLTGPGGTGKTRLSLQVAAEVLEKFEDGAWLVELAPLADPSLVPKAVATALHVREQPGRAVLAQLIDYLRTKKLLLVLDNCEHLITACAQLAEGLLQACPDLRLITSSREALGIQGEISYLVPPLRTPGLKDAATPTHLTQFESVRLFVERVRTLQPRFTLNDANSGAVAQICRRLDGIPLAIELAAARIKLFTPEQIAVRLDDRFRLLTGGSRTAVPRQQTLRALIEWSYDLLSEAERILLRRLSVFAGGWTVDAAEFVCIQESVQNHETSSLPEESSRLDVLEALSQLVNKSLVLVNEQVGETRHHFLETIRQFANEKLLESGESGRVHDRYLEYYLARAKQAEPKLHGAEQAMWIDRLDIEVDNFRAALDWAIKAGQVDQELEMAGALWWFWYIHDYFDEAREHLSAALARTAAGLPGEVRLKALIGLGFIYYAESSMAEARTVLQDAILLSQKLGNRRGLAEALQFLSAVEYVEVSNSGSGDFEDVRNLMEQSLAIWLSVGDKIGISWAKNLLGSVAQVEGDLAQARALWEESVALRRSASDWFLLAYSLRRLAEIALLQGDTAAAEAGYREGHELLINLRSKVGTTNNLVGFAGLALERGQLTRSARILGAIHAILKELALHLAPADEAAYERFLSNAQAQLPEEVFRTAWDEGSVLDIDQAIDYALNG